MALDYTALECENQKLWYRQCHGGHFSLVRDEGSFYKVMPVSAGNPQFQVWPEGLTRSSSQESRQGECHY